MSAVVRADDPQVMVDDLDYTAALIPVAGDPAHAWLRLPVEPGTHTLTATLGASVTAYSFSEYDATTQRMDFHCDGCDPADTEPLVCP